MYFPFTPLYQQDPSPSLPQMAHMLHRFQKEKNPRIRSESEAGICKCLPSPICPNAINTEIQTLFSLHGKCDRKPSFEIRNREGKAELTHTVAITDLQMPPNDKRPKINNRLFHTSPACVGMLLPQGPQYALFRSIQPIHAQNSYIRKRIVPCVLRVVCGVVLLVVRPLPL